MVAIEVATGPRHEATPVRVTGIDADIVTLCARIRWRGQRFESRTTFDVPASGVVDTAECAPVDGPYDGHESMGWLWAATPTDDAGAMANAEADAAVAFEACVDGEVHAQAEQTRSVAGPAVEHRVVETADIAGELFCPNSSGPHPGVVVLHGSGSDPPLGVAGLLAARGYAAFALRWLDHPTAPTDSLTEVPLSHVDSAAAFLRGLPEVRSDSLGVWGISKGGELALQIGARRSWPDAVVAVSASAVTMPGHEHGRSSWTDDGEPVPFLSPPDVPPEEAPTAPRERVTFMLDSASDNELAAATAPLDGSSPATLLLSGGADEVWPADRLCDPAVERLSVAGVACDHHVFPDAGHTILPPYHPATPETGGTADGNHCAAVEGWEVTRSFLDSRLRDGDPPR